MLSYLAAREATQTFNSNLWDKNLVLYYLSRRKLILKGKKSLNYCVNGCLENYHLLRNFKNVWKPQNCSCLWKWTLNRFLNAAFMQFYPFLVLELYLSKKFRNRIALFEKCQMLLVTSQLIWISTLTMWKTLQIHSIGSRPRIEFQFVFSDNHSKNNLRLIYGCKKCEFLIQSLMVDFLQFSNAISKLLFLEGRLGTRLYPVLNSTWNFLISWDPKTYVDRQLY